jgi:hypothetical protein
MIKIAISQAALDAISRSLPLGTVAFEAKVTAERERRLTKGAFWRAEARPPAIEPHKATSKKGKGQPHHRAEGTN